MLSAEVFGHGDSCSPVLLSEVNCNGEEANLTSCSNDADIIVCSHSEDAGVMCNNGGSKYPVYCVFIMAGFSGTIFKIILLLYLGNQTNSGTCEKCLLQLGLSLSFGFVLVVVVVTFTGVGFQLILNRW